MESDAEFVEPAFGYISLPTEDFILLNKLARRGAAAGDMLALLKEALGDGERAKPGDHHEWKQRVRAAILAAEGEKP